MSFRLARNSDNQPSQISRHCVSAGITCRGPAEKSRYDAVFDMRFSTIHRQHYDGYTPFKPNHVYDCILCFCLSCSDAAGSTRDRPVQRESELRSIFGDVCLFFMSGSPGRLLRTCFCESLDVDVLHCKVFTQMSFTQSFPKHTFVHKCICEGCKHTCALQA